MPSATQDNMAEEKITVVQPTENHTHTMIFLHGRESTASQFASEILNEESSSHQHLNEIFPHMKFVFPNAGLRHHARFNTEESQWFDIWDVRFPLEKKDLQIEGLRESIAFILNVVREEAAIVGPEKIILSGISQGCATAIHALFYGGIKLGGFVGLSSWLPFQDDIEL
jgi:lysophospholipase-2